MIIEVEDSSSRQPPSPSCSGNGSNDSGDFECNICFEFAQNPIVTLCGHLFCRPYLYQWPRFHSYSQGCLVCKALIQEEKLVLLHGRGKTPSNPRSKSIPEVDIPDCSSGQRREMAPPPQANNFSNFGNGFMGAFVPTATARFGNFAMSAAFGGLFPSLFNFQVHVPRCYCIRTTSGSYMGLLVHFMEPTPCWFPQAASQG